MKRQSRKWPTIAVFLGNAKEPLAVTPIPPRDFAAMNRIARDRGVEPGEIFKRALLKHVGLEEKRLGLAHCQMSINR
jgi:hypothetical protein